MQITANTTGFLAELFVSIDRVGRKHCVVVLKGTFDVDADGTCSLASHQADFVYVDEHCGDPGTTSVRYESEFVPIKPRPEVVIRGAAMAEGGRPVRQIEVGLAGLGIVKRAVVSGDRFWERRLAGIEPSPPMPFVEMPVIWDRAFGGSDASHDQVSRHGSELRNLVGVGFHLNSDVGSIVGQPLPNIEHPDQPMRSWSDQPTPIGFAPVGRGWRPRIEFAGTYDERWMNERLPLPPEDFDERYFQSAPLDQQVSTLSEGTSFCCLNLNYGGRFVTRMPPLTVPVRFIFNGRVESRTVTADTAILEPTDGRLILLGRASVALPRQITDLREIRVGLPPRSTDAKPHLNGLDEAVPAARLLG
jgi:hypothetical protein